MLGLSYCVCVYLFSCICVILSLHLCLSCFSMGDEYFLPLLLLLIVYSGYISIFLWRKLYFSCHSSIMSSQNFHVLSQVSNLSLLPQYQISVCVCVWYGVFTYRAGIVIIISIGMARPPTRLGNILINVFILVSAMLQNSIFENVL